MWKEVCESENLSYLRPCKEDRNEDFKIKNFKNQNNLLTIFKTKIILDVIIH